MRVRTGQYYVGNFRHTAHSQDLLEYIRRPVSIDDVVSVIDKKKRMIGCSNPKSVSAVTLKVFAKATYER